MNYVEVILQAEKHLLRYGKHDPTLLIVFAKNLDAMPNVV